MEKDPKYFFIGLVVLSLIIGLGLFLLWSAKISQKDSTIDYFIHIQEQSPAGLQEDGLVTLKGLKVGTIKDINFNPRNVEQVIVRASISADAPIKTDTKAIVRSNFVTGLAYIDLVRSSKEAKLLRLTESKQFIIPEGKTSLEKIEKSLPKIVDDLSTTIKRIEDFLSKDNANKFAHIIDNLDSISTDFAGSSKEISNSLVKASNEITSVANSLKSTISNVNSNTEIIANSSNNVLSEAEVFLSEASAQLEKTGNSISEAADSIKEGKESILGSSERNLLNE